MRMLRDTVMEDDCIIIYCVSTEYCHWESGTVSYEL